MSKFLCVWDCYGIEAVADITQFEFEDDERLLEMIKTGEESKMVSKFGTLISRFLLRARFNSHRNYEIYAIESNDDIKDTDIVQMFRLDPQGSAELIRERGVKIFSGRQTAKSVIT